MKISFFDIEHVKREAKRLRSDDPTLPHVKRLSKAATTLFGVRSFHELKKWREATINQTVVGSESLARCTFCGLEFCPDVPADRKMHQERHDAYEEATSVLKYAPGQHAAREAMKKEGYELLRSPDLESQVKGLLLVIRGWFDRSLDSAIDGRYWKQHPTFELYASYVAGDLDDMSSAAVEALVHRYGRQDGVIPKGRSYWYPPKK